MVTKTNRAFNNEMLRSLKLTNRNFELLSFLIDTNEEFEFFIDKFWNGTNYQLSSISNYRLYKMNKSKNTLKGFLVGFEINPTKSLEKLFQHPVSEGNLLFLRKRLRDKKMSLSDIYKEHCLNPEYFMLSFIL